MSVEQQAETVVDQRVNLSPAIKKVLGVKHTFSQIPADEWLRDAGIQSGKNGRVERTGRIRHRTRIILYQAEKPDIVAVFDSVIPPVSIADQFFIRDHTLWRRKVLLFSSVGVTISQLGTTPTQASQHWTNTLQALLEMGDMPVGTGVFPELRNLHIMSNEQATRLGVSTSALGLLITRSEYEELMAPFRVEPPSIVLD